jgi:hypothetical protein
MLSKPSSVGWGLLAAECRTFAMVDEKEDKCRQSPAGGSRDGQTEDIIYIKFNSNISFYRTKIDHSRGQPSNPLVPFVAQHQPTDFSLGLIFQYIVYKSLRLWELQKSNSEAKKTRKC